MIAEREIRILINSERYEIEESLFSEELDGDALYSHNQTDAEPENMQIKTRGLYRITDDERVEISYAETELTGMEGSDTVISYGINKGEIVSMIRTGAVSTTLVFEKGKRHHCVYKTPFMPFEVCIRTIDVKNELSAGGELIIDYIVEIRGARAERTKFSMKIMD